MLGAAINVPRERTNTQAKTILFMFFFRVRAASLIPDLPTTYDFS
jgi:hypothetical protein